MAAKKSDPDKKSNQNKIEVKSAPVVNDIAKPGSTAASPTSRPIITNHKNIIKKDPMVSGVETEEEGTKEKSSFKSETKIEPIDEEIKTGSAEAEEAVPAQTSDDTQETDDKKDDGSDKEDKTEDEKKDDNESSDSAAIDSLADAAQNNKLSAKDEEARKAQEEKVNQLISSKKYNVSIVEGGHKATSQKIVSLLLVILLLSAIGVYLAIDAGYLDIGMELPYDLVKD